MFIRAYLRASTHEQDAERAKASLIEFVGSRGLAIASFYAENESGAKLERPELNRLLSDCRQGDVLLIESVDRLTRLNAKDWGTLKQRINVLGVRLVALDLPTSHLALETPQTLTEGILNAVNAMLVEVMAVMARKDYEMRRERQAQGIAKAKSQGKYKGRAVDYRKYEKIIKLLNSGVTHREICELLKCSPSTIQSAVKALSS